MPLSLVIAEHQNGEVTPATLSAVTAALTLGEVHILVMGAGCEAAARNAATINGVTKVLLADDPALEHHLAEACAEVIMGLASSYSHLVAPATAFGKDVMPRIAALQDVQQISDVTAVLGPKLYERFIYAGNALCQVESCDELQVITVRATAFEPTSTGEGSAAVEAIAGSSDNTLSRFVRAELSSSARPDLTSARVVVSGGRGMQSSENFAMLERIADKLNAAVGASRAAVDAGYVPNDYQVGQTGKVVAPDLYIAVGISGAIQHLAGMKDSKVIVAINKDEEAPIFQVADYGLIADLFEALPLLEQALEEA